MQLFRLHFFSFHVNYAQHFCYPTAIKINKTEFTASLSLSCTFFKCLVLFIYSKVNGGLVL